MYSKVVLIVSACLAVCQGAGHSSTTVDNQNGGKFGYKVSHEYVLKEGSPRLHVYDEGSAQPVRGVPYYAGGESPSNYNNGAEASGPSPHGFYRHHQHQLPGVAAYRSPAQEGGEVAYYAKAPFEGTGFQALPLSSGPSASYSNLAGSSGVNGFRQF